MEAAAVSFSDQGSDSVVEFCCSECDDETKEARFYCENCLKFYCEECIEPHNKLYKKHNSFARGEVNKWPLAKKYMDFLERCEVHKGKQIEFICEDHDKLCCNACVLLNHSNQTLKLFDQQYRSIGRCEVSGSCKDMCKISPNEIAIALFNEPDSSDDDSSGDETSSSDKIHEVQLIGLDKGQLIKDRIIQLTHLCIGIASYQDDLYVTSGTALYHYKLTGSLVGKIHEDKSDNHTVWKCAVGLHGDKIFLTNTDKDCLITLAMDGSVLSRLDGIGRHADIHVTPLGQVLVFRDKKGIIQIDGDGRTIIAKDGRIFDIRVGDIRVRVQSVYYNQMTQAFILIPEEDEYMFVFEKQ
ncbi:uncharacterized protein LOC127862183 isoform X2 [Dreissena polymorpha]|uniref:uncharacterized protein LOC127862183 isoform X2 n=1 Tax=Dreissena polymorpha TaxID=45954 RepID=UPI0022651AC4|nr:uncharacterized protein LOC127862183 isoform X2 [Dreissena polymorpha]